MLTITMGRAREADACGLEDRLAQWQKRGPLPGEDEEIPLGMVIRRLDLRPSDAIWALRIARPSEDARRIGAEVARRTAVRAMDRAEGVIQILAQPRQGQPDLRASLQAGRACLEGRGGREEARAVRDACRDAVWGAPVVHERLWPAVVLHAISSVLWLGRCVEEAAYSGLETARMADLITGGDGARTADGDAIVGDLLELLGGEQ